MQKGMIKVSVVYPNTEGKKFKTDFYCNILIPKFDKLPCETIKSGIVEKDLEGANPNSDGPFIGIGNIYFERVEGFGSSFGSNKKLIMSDQHNITNIEPNLRILDLIT